MKKTTLVIAGLLLYLNANSQNTFTDSRDGEVYQTVTVDGQTWLAENLRFETKEGSDSWRGDTGRKTKYSYMPILEADTKFDKTHGRYYSYNAALKACPNGWTLPNESDFAKLSEKFGGDKKAGHSLKSKDDWPWRTSGDNSSGMNIKPFGSIYKGNNAGHHITDARIIESAEFWVKGKVKDGKAPFRILTARDGNTEEAYNFRQSVFTISKIKMTIRCIKK